VKETKCVELMHGVIIAISKYTMQLPQLLIWCN